MMPDLVELAKEAIERVFSDTSVSQDVTIERLDDLTDDIDVKLELLTVDDE